ncbi:MAG: Rab family GTPase [Chloroflexota bacterium]
MTTISTKVCLLGDFAVGKTSLVRRFVYDIFEDKYISTIGVKVSRKTIQVPKDDQLVNVTLMLWDLAGSETFDRMRSTYLRGSSGAILTCDLTRPETLDSLKTYAEDLQRVSPKAQLVIVANKADLADQHQITIDQLESAAQNLGAPYFVSSAKTGDQVDKLFGRLGQQIAA